MSKLAEIFAMSFNHCSAVCPCENGALIAWYSGLNECHNNQSVYIIFISKDNRSDIVRIGDMTGNPVMWKVDDDIFILWSKFEDDGIIANPVDRWKYCSLWVQKIEVSDKPLLIGKPRCIASSKNNLLGRCPAVVYNNKIMLPLYDEVEAESVIYDGSEFVELFRFGQNMIQPTMWVKNSKLYAICRNFRTSCKKARYTSLNGNIWESPKETKIYNVNNSLCVTNWKQSEAVVWNNTVSNRRDRLTFGLLNKDYMGHLAAVPIKIIDAQYGSYPFCVVHDDLLHITFTNNRKSIEYHILEWRELSGRNNAR